MKAQASMESLLVLLAFFFVLAQLASFELNQSNTAKEFMKELNAMAIVEKCSMAIDSMSANSGAIVHTWREKCYGKGNSSVYYADGNKEKYALTIAGKIETIQKGKGFIVRLENESHYR